MTDFERMQEFSKGALIAELKKIRQEIYDIEEPDHDFEGFYHCQNEALELINKRISELKGETE